jgi:hypothetical protein
MTFTWEEVAHCIDLDILLCTHAVHQSMYIHMTYWHLDGRVRLDRDD